MWRKVDFIKLATTSSVAGLTASSKALPKAKRYQKSHGHCLRVWPLQLSERWRKHYIWEVRSANRWDAAKTANACRQHWPTEGPSSPPRGATLDHMPHNQHFKRWTNWATKFCPIYHIRLTSHQPTATSSSVPTKLCRENASTTSRRQKMLSKSSANPEAWICMQQEQTSFSLAKMCGFQWFLVWLIKMRLSLVIVI